MRQIRLLMMGCFVPAFVLLGGVSGYAATMGGKQPITVNGDVVEFKSEGREVVAEGNVEIVQTDSKLTADKMHVFIDEKIAIAEGHVRFMKKDGEELEGETIVYDFGAQTGTIINADVRMTPYYGKADVMEKISATQYVMSGASVSSCDLPHPHYHLWCREVKMSPGNLLTAKGIKFFAGDIPILYLPSFSQRMTDKKPIYMIIPGSSKDLGAYALGSYRYYLNDNAKGVFHLDWYQNMGWAQGVDLNYNTKIMGIGNAKYYRITEDDQRVKQPTGGSFGRHRDERSKIEVRHKWDITDKDHLVFDYFRQSDANFRKDYFFREYEKVMNPATMLLVSHVYPNATLSFLSQPRVNKFESVLQKIPEIKLETVNQKILETPFYFKNISTMSNVSSVSADSSVQAEVFRVDTSNQLSYLFKFMGLDFSPFVGHQDTYYSRGVDANRSFLRGMFFTGIDVSTKLYRLFDIDTNVMNLDINKLRHIVTPTIQYKFQPRPTVVASLLQQLESVDALERSDAVTFGLENKFQTKRNGESVDLATLLLTSNYLIERIKPAPAGLQNVTYDFEFKPYAAWELDADGVYDIINRVITTNNIDYWINMKQSRIGVGHRFANGASNQVTANFEKQLNPFWKLNVYERFEAKSGTLVEQEYRLNRDMHCWTAEFIINQREGNGISFLLAFTLKAFPEFGVSAEKSFSPPRTESTV